MFYLIINLGNTNVDLDVLLKVNEYIDQTFIVKNRFFGMPDSEM